MGVSWNHKDASIIAHRLNGKRVFVVERLDGETEGIGVDSRDCSFRRHVFAGRERRLILGCQNLRRGGRARHEANEQQGAKCQPCFLRDTRGKRV